MGSDVKCPTKWKVLSYKEAVIKASISVDKKTKQKDYLATGKLPIIDQGQSLIGGYSNDMSCAVNCKLPVIVFGDHTKVVKFINFSFGAGADGIKILQPKECLLPKYLFYYTQVLTKCIEDKGYARHYQYIEKKNIHYPPLPEQERIVSKIEELLSNLDASVAELRTAKERLKMYRQAVLDRAFGKIFTECKMNKVAQMIDPHPSHRTPSKYLNGIPYIGIGDIDYDSEQIRFSLARTVAPTILSEHLERYTLSSGDFIMGKIGTIGKPFKLPFPQNYTLSANVILIQPLKKIIDSDYLYWQFRSTYVIQQLTKGASATSQAAFGIKKARLLNIKVCNLNTQKKIVQEIESRLSVCDNIEKTVNESLRQAQALRQSILKKAFEGKLV
ncbi:restriction endonuclease subunit S [Caproicibacter sp.]|uniref:restriction endonuclease subunit S n=1 Tax=Caproicibacter sp. TaxID=2814884 RepID=UPI003988EC0E